MFFRASTREQALRLGLRGHARNLPDGRVEVLAVGDAAAIETLAQWLQHGPPMAEVRSVERSDVDERRHRQASRSADQRERHDEFPTPGLRPLDRSVSIGAIGLSTP